MKYFSLLAVFLFVGCGGGSNNDWPEGDRNAFLAVCVDAGGPAGECKCALEELEERYDTLDEANRNIDMEELVDIVDQCDE